MHFRSTHNFFANGQMHRDNHSIPTIISGSYPLFKPGYIEFKLLIKAQDWPRQDGNNVLGDLLDLKNPIQLSGTTERGQDIWVSKLRFRSLERATRKVLPSSDDQFIFKGIAEFLIEGNFEEFNTSDGSIKCYVSISPTRLAQTRGQYTTHTDGTITRYSSERKGIRWSTRLGEAELLDNYEYVETEEEVGLDVALARVQRCQITIMIPPCGIVSLKTILSDLDNALEEPLMLLSLLSRRNIGWYEATAHLFYSEKIPINEPRATARFQQWAEYDNEANAWLTSILPLGQTLTDGLFQELLENYMKSPLKDTIRQTTQYLLIAYEKGYIEAKLGIIYAALESLVDGLSKYHELTQLMSDTKFNKLARILRYIIRRVVPDRTTAEGVIKKLSELKRPAIRDRLLKLLQIYNLDKMKLRHSEAEISSELENILSRRNTYIHTGKIDKSQHPLDLYLLQELVELWLLKLLGCADSEIRPSAYSSILIKHLERSGNFEVEIDNFFSAEI